MAKVALLIGVSEYEADLKPLPGSIKDVDAMKQVLAHPDMGDFAETDIMVLKNPQRQEMEDAIFRLFSDRQKSDLLLFYFSGHGIKDETGKLYLATRGTHKNNGRLVKPSAVAASSLHESINESRSERQIIILDCCFSGAIAQGMTIKNDGTINLQEHLGSRGRAILTSSTSMEYSFAPQITDQNDSELSIYTRYLVEGIENGAADADGDGLIAVEELHEYASKRVKEAAPAMTPKFYPVEEGYKIIVAKSRKNEPKLKFRRKLQTLAEQEQGNFSAFAQRLLEDKRIEWNISIEEAATIKEEVLQPYREYERKKQEYKQALIEQVQLEYPFSAATKVVLKEYQQHLKLRDSDIAEVEALVLAPLEPESKAQVEYRERIYVYEQEFRKVVQTQYPLDPSTLRKLKSLQRKLRLNNKDVANIEQPIRESLDVKHQEKLIQEKAKRQQERKRQTIKIHPHIEADHYKQEKYKREAAVSPKAVQRNPESTKITDLGNDTNTSQTYSLVIFAAIVLGCIGLVLFSQIHFRKVTSPVSPATPTSSPASSTTPVSTPSPTISTSIPKSTATSTPTSTSTAVPAPSTPALAPASSSNSARSSRPSRSPSASPSTRSTSSSTHSPSTKSQPPASPETIPAPPPVPPITTIPTNPAPTNPAPIPSNSPECRDFHCED